MSSLHRRDFLALAAASAGAAALRVPAFSQKDSKMLPEPTPQKLPRWRGFNLLGKFTAPGKPYLESDYATIAEWGFNFTRLPCSYRCWSEGDPAKWLDINDNVLKEIDQAVEWGKQYGIHVNINFHRAPGYCVNPPAEPLSLWDDEKALAAACHHWAHFARRYKGIPNNRLSFDLLNEPSDLPEEKYVKVARALVAAIRAEDPTRLIVADGLKWGNQPVHGLADLNVAQSTRGYAPMQISHHKASWIKGSDQWPDPTWPLKIKENDIWDKERLRQVRIVPWKALEAKGVGIHVGEWGAFNSTPHAVALAWMKDSLELWRDAGWGWALWEFRGSFGVLNSNRKDVTYEDFRGDKLDRAMLELLKAY